MSTDQTIYHIICVCVVLLAFVFLCVLFVYVNTCQTMHLTGRSAKEIVTSARLLGESYHSYDHESL